MGFDRTGLTSIAEENTDDIGAEGPRGCRRCSTTLQTRFGPCQTVLVECCIQSRGKPDRDEKDNVQAMPAARDSCRSVPACCGPEVSPEAQEGHPEDLFDEVSGTGHGRWLLFQDAPEGRSPRTACTSTSTVGPAGWTTWWRGWSRWDPPACARSTRARPDTGGSCSTRRATSSAASVDRCPTQRKP